MLFRSDYLQLQTEYLDNPRDLFPEFKKLYQCVKAIHSSGVIHRDIKLSNIMKGDKGESRIIDYNLSATIDDIEGLRTLCGTPSYFNRFIADQSNLYSMPKDRLIKLWMFNDFWCLMICMSKLLSPKMIHSGKDMEEILESVFERKINYLPENSDMAEMINEVLEKYSKASRFEDIKITETFDEYI